MSETTETGAARRPAVGARRNTLKIRSRLKGSCTACGSHASTMPATTSPAL